MASICTSSVVEHSKFRPEAELPKRQIPTYEDVFKAYCWSLKADDTESKTLFKIAQMLAIEVQFIYTAPSIPSIDILFLLVYKDLFQKHVNLKNTQVKVNTSFSKQVLFF